MPQQPPKTPPANSLGRIVIKDRSGIAFPNSNVFFESPIGLGVLSAQVTLQPTKVFPGVWTCEITNHTSVALTFVTDITNASDVANEETQDAVMGSHTAQTVPTHDFLARNHVVCDLVQDSADPELRRE